MKNYVLILDTYACSKVNTAYKKYCTVKEAREEILRLCCSGAIAFNQEAACDNKIYCAEILRKSDPEHFVKVMRTDDGYNWYTPYDDGLEWRASVIEDFPGVDQL